MVRQSTDNFHQYIDEVRQHYVKRYPKKIEKIEMFIDYLCETYKQNQRTYFPYKVMKYMYLRRQNVINKNQHYWVALIGKKGGEGKSTLGKNVGFFLDTSFHSDKRCAQNYEKFINIVYKTKKEDEIEFPFILLDETDPTTHHLSKEGRTLRTITTKIRQLNLFVGVCANSLLDIPAFIYERINTIIYINDKHRFWLWDNNYDKPMYSIIDDIKHGWREKKHGIFVSKHILGRAMFKNQRFSKHIPFNEKYYLKDKHDDLFNDIEEYLATKNKSDAPPPEKVLLPDRFDIEVLKLKSQGMQTVKVARIMNRSRQQINRIMKKWKKWNEEHAPV